MRLELRPAWHGTIIIEREVTHQLGPPVIVWKRPSAEGATQSQFGAVRDPAARAALDDQSVTAYMLFTKARRALDNGDCVSAAALLNRARSQEPSPGELRDIDSQLERLRRSAECAATARFRFEKTQDHSTILRIEGLPGELIDRLFDPKRADLEPLRQKMIPMFIVQSEAKAKVEELKGKGIQGKALERAQQQLQSAQAIVRKEAKDNEQIIMKVVHE